MQTPLSNNEDTHTSTHARTQSQTIHYLFIDIYVKFTPIHQQWICIDLIMRVGHLDYDTDFATTSTPPCCLRYYANELHCDHFLFPSSPPVSLPSPPLPQGPEQLQTSQFGGNNCSGCKMCVSLIHFANVASLPELFATGLICPRAFISANHNSSLAIVANANLPELEKQCQFCSTNDCHLKMKPISLMYQVH